MNRLDTAIELNNLRLVFSAVGLAQDLWRELREDFSFAGIVGRTLLAPRRARARTGPMAGELFPPFERRDLPGLAGKRIALVASGGAGATASLIGVKRAFEEAGLEVAAISACSGAVLFSTLWAAGLDARQIAGFWLSLRDRDYVDPSWPSLVRGLAGGLRGWAGLLRGDAIERSYRELLGDLPLGHTSIPISIVVWNIDVNRVEFLGSTQTPELPVARAVRIAISIPVLVEPVRVGRHIYGDGGIVDIFPVQPVIDDPRPFDIVLGVNCYYGRDFGGEDITGWYHRLLAILHASGQLRWSAHIQLAREHVRQLGDRLTLLHPVPYEQVRGAKFYRSFLDRSDWPHYIRLGHQAATEALTALARRADMPAVGVTLH